MCIFTQFPLAFASVLFLLISLVGHDLIKTDFLDSAIVIEIGNRISVMKEWCITTQSKMTTLYTDSRCTFLNFCNWMLFSVEARMMTTKETTFVVFFVFLFSLIYPYFPIYVSGWMRERSVLKFSYEYCINQSIQSSFLLLFSFMGPSGVQILARLFVFSYCVHFVGFVSIINCCISLR